MFQSLFYWKSHCNTGIALQIRQKRKVSILVLLEVSLQRRKKITRRNKKNKFQSLFYWKSHCNLTPAEFMGLKNIMFQSLFYWKSHCNFIRVCKGNYRQLKFQSLFYWKSHCNIWITIWLFVYNYVSILVLLEVSLQPRFHVRSVMNL